MADESALSSAGKCTSVDLVVHRQRIGSQTPAGFPLDLELENWKRKDPPHVFCKVALSKGTRRIYLERAESITAPNRCKDFCEKTTK